MPASWNALFIARLVSAIRLFLFAAAVAALSSPAVAEDEKPKLAEPTESETLFLQRLMMAESGGRLDARNPRSSALGPFQFIESTFYDLLTRYFPELAEDKTYAQIQQLRTDLETARNAALAYTRENAAYLNGRGIAPEPGFLRLAFLLGPGGAEAVISAKPETPVSDLLSKTAIAANPFLNGMSAEQFIDRAKREAAGLTPLPIMATTKAAVAQPKVKVRCNLERASCRKWLALAKTRAVRRAASK
jgi:hypothetical protein